MSIVDLLRPKNQTTQKPKIECNQVACKAFELDEDSATENGWYLNAQGHWFCYQHSPALRRPTA